MNCDRNLIHTLYFFVLKQQLWQINLNIFILIRTKMCKQQNKRKTSFISYVIINITFIIKSGHLKIWIVFFVFFFFCKYYLKVSDNVPELDLHLKCSTKYMLVYFSLCKMPWNAFMGKRVNHSYPTAGRRQIAYLPNLVVLKP